MTLERELLMPFFRQGLLRLAFWLVDGGLSLGGGGEEHVLSLVV